MTNEETRSFLGIPVKGKISFGSERADQKPLEELAPLIQAVLDDPTIKSFSFTGYTPYFDDGDPCVYGAHRFEIDLAWDTEKDGENEDDDWKEFPYSYKETLGERKYTWERNPSGGRGIRVPGEYTGPDEARYDRIYALYEALEGGEFDDVLLKNFGDHARVTVSKDGIEVEFYDHD